MLGRDIGKFLSGCSLILFDPCGFAGSRFDSIVMLGAPGARVDTMLVPPWFLAQSLPDKGRASPSWMMKRRMISLTPRRNLRFRRRGNQGAKAWAIQGGRGRRVKIQDVFETCVASTIWQAKAVHLRFSVSHVFQPFSVHFTVVSRSLPAVLLCSRSIFVSPPSRCSLLPFSLRSNSLQSRCNMRRRMARVEM